MLALGQEQVVAARNRARTVKPLARIVRPLARIVKGVAVTEKLKRLVVEDMKVGSSFRSSFRSNKMSELFPSRSPSSSPLPDLKTVWAQVMHDLLLATHCHSCGASVNVALIGYCGAHCSKRCWQEYEFELMDDFVCAWEDCAICAGVKVSLARSVRSLGPHDGWPMLCTKPCNNTAIASRSPVSVTHHYDSE